MKLYMTTLLYILLLANTAQSICMDGSFTTNNGIPIPPMTLTLHDVTAQPISWAEPLDSTVAQIAYDHAPFIIQDVIDTMQNYPTEIVSKRNYLFVGKPGTGKSTLARAVAQMASTGNTKWNCAFLRVAKYTNKFQSSAGGGLVEDIDPILKSKMPCVIVLDELTHITKNYEQDQNFNNDAATTVWSVLDECSERDNIIIIGTTNNAKAIPAPLQSRFNKRGIIKIPMPSPGVRTDLINHLFKKAIQDQAINASYLEMLVGKTSNKSFRDMIDFAEQVIDHAKQRTIAKKQALGDSEQVTGPAQAREYTITQADIEAVMATWRSRYHPSEFWDNHGDAICDGIIKSLPITIPATIGIFGIGVTIWQFRKGQKATADQMKASSEQAQRSYEQAQKSCEQAAAQLRIAMEQNRRAEEQTAEHRKEVASAKNMQLWGLVVQGTSVLVHAGSFAVNHKQEVIEGAKWIASFFVTGTPS